MSSISKVVSPSLVFLAASILVVLPSFLPSIASSLAASNLAKPILDIKNSPIVIGSLESVFLSAAGS